MPEPISHSAIVAGTVSGAIAFAFDVPAPVVFAAFAGTCFAIGIAEQTTFLRAITMAVGGTVASAYITPLAHHAFTSIEPKSIAVIIAFIMVHYKDKVVSGFGEILTSAKEAVIKKMGGEIKRDENIGGEK